MFTDVKRNVVAFVVFVLLTACGGGGGGGTGPVGPPLPQFPVEVWNKSQFPLRRLHVNDAKSSQLSGTLFPDAMEEVLLSDGDRITVVRPVRLEIATDEEVALETALGLPIDATGYVLWVFDEAFRLFPPDFSN